MHQQTKSIQCCTLFPVYFNWQRKRLPGKKNSGFNKIWDKIAYWHIPFEQLPLKSQKDKQIWLVYHKYYTQSIYVVHIANKPVYLSSRLDPIFREKRVTFQCSAFFHSTLKYLCKQNAMFVFTKFCVSIKWQPLEQQTQMSTLEMICHFFSLLFGHLFAHWFE